MAESIGVTITEDMPVLADNVAGHRGVYEVLDHRKISSKVIYRKTESLNTDLSDTYHDIDKVWVEEFTNVPLNIAGVTPRLKVESNGIDRPLEIDDGLIIQFHGTFKGQRGRVGKDLLSQEQADEIAELDPQNAPEMHNLWEFRIGKLVRTNGPELTIKSLEDEETKRLSGQNDVMKSIEGAFAALADKMSNGGAVGESGPPTGDDLVRALQGMNETEREMLFQKAELAAENAE